MDFCNRNSKSIWPLRSNEGILDFCKRNPFGHFGPTRVILDFCNRNSKSIWPLWSNEGILDFCNRNSKSIWPLWSNEGILDFCITEIQFPFGPTRGILDFCNRNSKPFGHFGPTRAFWIFAKEIHLATLVQRG